MGENQMAELVQQVTSLNLAKQLEELDISDDSNTNDIEDDDEDDYDDFVDEAVKANAEQITRRRMIAVFEEWLIQKSSCPVTFKWEDLGEYFWPRWVRKGNCIDDGSRQVANSSSSSSLGCSWPMGMKCVAGESKTLHILRWHCRRRSSSPFGGGSSSGEGGSKHKCKWYKVPFPVTKSCKCACQ